MNENIIEFEKELNDLWEKNPNIYELYIAHESEIDNKVFVSYIEKDLINFQNTDLYDEYINNDIYNLVFDELWEWYAIWWFTYYFDRNGENIISWFLYKD